MPNTSTYNAAYFQANKAKIRAARLRRRARFRTDPVILARSTWLKRVMRTHSLTSSALASLLGCNPQLIIHWLITPDALHWEPMLPQWEAKIKTLIPEDAPLSPEILDRLNWSALKREAYLGTWGQHVSLTPAELRAWRRQLGLSQRLMARKFDVSTKNYQDWELGTRPIPRVHQRNGWWLRAQEASEKEHIRRKKSLDTE